MFKIQSFQWWAKFQDMLTAINNIYFSPKLKADRYWDWLSYHETHFTWHTEWLQKGKALRRIYFSSLIWPNIPLEGSLPWWQLLGNLTVPSPIKVPLFLDSQYLFYSRCAIWPLSVINLLSWMAVWGNRHHYLISLIPWEVSAHWNLIHMALIHFPFTALKFKRHYPQVREAKDQVDNSLQMI